MNESDNLIDIQVLLNENGIYKKIDSLQLNLVPRQGEFIGQFSTKDIYKITHVIYEDIQIILLVEEFEHTFPEIITISYSNVEE